MYREGTYRLDSNKLFKLWNHWLNPMGNWHEPMPYPRKRQQQAPKGDLLAWLWWTARNPLHNFNHFWIGITPRGERYEWLTPTWRLPRLAGTLGDFEWYIGWSARGSFGIAFRKQET